MNGIQDKINKLQDSLKDKKQKDLRFDIVEDALCFKDGESFKGITEKPSTSNKDIEGAINAANLIKCIDTLKTFINILTNKKSIGYTDK